MRKIRQLDDDMTEQDSNSLLCEKCTEELIISQRRSRQQPEGPSGIRTSYPCCRKRHHAVPAALDCVDVDEKAVDIGQGVLHDRVLHDRVRNQQKPKLNSALRRPQPRAGSAPGQETEPLLWCQRALAVGVSKQRIRMEESGLKNLRPSNTMRRYPSSELSR
jgi:hypothetical protein